MLFFKYFFGFSVSLEHLLLPGPILILISVCAGLISICQPLRLWGLFRGMAIGCKLKYIWWWWGIGIGDMRLKDVVGGGDGWAPLTNCGKCWIVYPLWGSFSSLSSPFLYQCFLVSFINILESLSHGMILRNPVISLFWFCLV